MGKLARKNTTYSLENGKVTSTKEEFDYIDYRQIRVDHVRMFTENRPTEWRMTPLFSWILDHMGYARDGQYCYLNRAVFEDLGLKKRTAYLELDQLVKMRFICKVDGFKKIQVNPFFFGKGTLKEILNLRLSYLNGTPPTETPTIAVTAQAETGTDGDIPY